jgi:protein SOK2
MNHPQPYLETQHAHLSAGPSYAPPSQAAAGMGHYSQYPPPAPALQPGPGSYGPSPSSYGYGYGPAVTSPQSAGPALSAPGMNAQIPPLPGEPMPSLPPSPVGAVLTFPGMAAAPHQQHQPHQYPPGPQSYGAPSFDSTGQLAPTGMKPRVTATLWEDEGSLCFQVEAKGVCVARREGTQPPRPMAGPHRLTAPQTTT